MVGGVFTTVTVNESDANTLAWSYTDSVKVAEPILSTAGVMVTVRFAPEPPKTRLPAGNRVPPDQPAPIRSCPAGVSMSPTVNVIAPVVPFSGIVMSGTSEIVGGFDTSTTNDLLVLAPSG